MNGPFSIAALIAIACALVFFVRWALARQRLTEEARAEYQARGETKTATIAGVDEWDFVKLYVSAHEPRSALYIAAALIAAVLVTPPAAIGLVHLWPVIVSMLDGGPWYDVGYWPWMFYIFFGMCGVWAFTAAVVARVHHARAPEPFQAALARARGEPLDDVVIPRKRPEWAKRARPDASGAEQG